MVQIGDHLREMCDSRYFLLRVADGCMTSPISVCRCAQEGFSGSTGRQTDPCLLSRTRKNGSSHGEPCPLALLPASRFGHSYRTKDVATSAGLRLASLRGNIVTLVWTGHQFQTIPSSKPDNATVTCRCPSVHGRGGSPQWSAVPTPRSQCCTAPTRAFRSFFGFYLFPLHTLSGKRVGPW
jgi:hypothetical protein